MPDTKTLWRWLWTQTFWRLRLGALGARSMLYRPILVANPRHIKIGSRTAIRDHARLEVLMRPGVDWQPILKIGNNVNIEQGVHIVCHCDVTIEDNVSITPYCVIVDTVHPYDPPDHLTKIGARLPQLRSHVRIGRGTFIGAHAIIMPNVTIGEQCVVGAGSVVTKDVAPYTVVAGVPAQAVKTYDRNNQIWTYHRP